MHHKGFTLIEVLLVFMMMSAMTLLTLPIGVESSHSDKRLLISSLIHTQYSALLKHRYMTFETIEVDSDYPIVFTGKVMTNQAQTIRLKNNGVLVIMLGPGRIHE